MCLYNRCNKSFLRLVHKNSIIDKLKTDKVYLVSQFNMLV